MVFVPRTFAVLRLAIALLVPVPLAAQLSPPSTGGVPALLDELRMLGHHKRVLMIGAHPDDEDTELLTVAVRGLGAEAAYLSLTRGEGGQNLIGPELGEALGILRTEELLAARRIDGARQYFTRAFDFGFSKTLDETLTEWPRDTILKDVVRIIRRFRPQVVVSVFSGTPRDGHGQHQAAGWAAREAFRLAGDSGAFAELESEEGLVPHAPLKLYRSTRFDTAATTLVLEGGTLDPSTGKSYHQLAMAARSLHRSQDMGQLQRIGPSKVRLALLEDRTGRGTGGLFAGVDTSLAQGRSPRASWDSLERDLRRTSDIPLTDAEAVLPRLLVLTRRYGALREAQNAPLGSLTKPTSGRAADDDQHRRLSRAIVIATRLIADAYAEAPRAAPGESLAVTTHLWNAGGSRLRAAGRITNRTLDGVAWMAPVPPDDYSAGNERRFATNVAIVPAQTPTTPYFLRRPRGGALYDWSSTTLPGAASADSQWATVLGEPFELPPIGLQLSVGMSGEGQPTPFTVDREVTFRYNDQAFGERRSPIFIVPRVDVKIDPQSELWRASDRRLHRLAVVLTHGARDTTRGTVGLEVPAGWATPAARRFELARPDDRETVTFDLRPPTGATGKFDIRAVATDERGQRYDVGSFVIDYPHIRPRAYVQPAIATISVAPLELPKVARVGYVRGAADRIPEALLAAGFPIQLLDAAALEGGDLSRYDAIVIGPRAYETEPAVAANNRRLLDYARAGGTLIVQYQQQLFFAGRFAPHPMTVGGPSLRRGSNGDSARGAGATVAHDRVTDERADVRVLDSSAVVLRGPNRIGVADWEGWVQERGLYFARTWSSEYRAVIETGDPGEQPLRGGLLIAPVGRGTYVYTGLSFFRQIPAGVPGAFRLFANLLALGARR